MRDAVDGQKNHRTQACTRVGGVEPDLKTGANHLLVQDWNMAAFKHAFSLMSGNLLLFH